MMAQIFADSPEVIYNILVNDAQFSDLLGTYTFTGGATSGSIAILTPGQNLPLLKSQTGLECIIHDSGDIRRKDLSYDNSSLLTTWKVFLVVWDPATGSNLDLAAKRIMHLFNGATSIETLATAQGLRARVQTMIMIPEEGGLHKDAIAILESI